MQIYGPALYLIVGNMAPEEGKILVIRIFFLLLLEISGVKKGSPQGWRATQQAQREGHQGHRAYLGPRWSDADADGDNFKSEDLDEEEDRVGCGRRRSRWYWGGHPKQVGPPVGQCVIEDGFGLDLMCFLLLKVTWFSSLKFAFLSIQVQE